MTTKILLSHKEMDNELLNKFVKESIPLGTKINGLDDFWRNSFVLLKLGCSDPYWRYAFDMDFDYFYFSIYDAIDGSYIHKLIDEINKNFKNLNVKLLYDKHPNYIFYLNDTAYTENSAPYLRLMIHHIFRMLSKTEIWNDYGLVTLNNLDESLLENFCLVNNRLSKTNQYRSLSYSNKLSVEDLLNLDRPDLMEKMAIIFRDQAISIVRQTLILKMLRVLKDDIDFFDKPSGLSIGDIIVADNEFSKRFEILEKIKGEFIITDILGTTRLISGSSFTAVPLTNDAINQLNNTPDLSESKLRSIYLWGSASLPYFSIDKTGRNFIDEYNKKKESENTVSTVKKLKRKTTKKTIRKTSILTSI